MADPEHLAILKQGVEAWNRWREKHPEERPELAEAELTGADLHEADFDDTHLSEADLAGADLTGAVLTAAVLRGSNLRAARLFTADLTGATLRRANLSGANLMDAQLYRVDLRQADLREADLTGAFLSEADLREADLSGADLTEATLVETDLRRATVNGCRIYGVSAWNLRLEEAQQSDLVITSDEEPAVTVDNLEVGQFIYLLLNNERLRQIIDTITSKVVLILGRFTEERKTVLDAVREELRKRGHVPILFDCERPASKDMTGTVETLARMARFIIADLTDPSSVPHELATIVPFLRTTPVISLRSTGSRGYRMFADLKRYDWVLDDTHEYENGPSLIRSLPELISLAEERVKQLRGETDEAGHQ